MPRKEIFYMFSVKDAVAEIIPYLEDTPGRAAHKSIYFDGWDGLAASAVLRDIAEDPLLSLRNKFDRIIHIDCSRWKSRRELQRAIANELKLHQTVISAFDRQDKEDDFSGIDEDSRAEIGDVGRVIVDSLLQYRCLVVFHNGSTDMVDLVDSGIPHPLFGTKIMWTFRGRLRLNPQIREKVESSHLLIYRNISYLYGSTHIAQIAQLVMEEAAEVAKYTQHKHMITPEMAAKCIAYLLWLNRKGGVIMKCNWATHASNYWVCDGIIGDHDNQAWEVAHALHQEIRLEDYSSNEMPIFGDKLNTPPRRWILLATSSNIEEKAHPETTTLFLASQSESDQTLAELPNDMFHQADQLRVLKLCNCSFSYSSPPFYCCYNLRFLGLDSCMDHDNLAEEKSSGQVMSIFKRLWVLDVCQTNWELDFPEEIEEQVDTNIREVHISKGRIWRSSLAWRHLQSLHKLRVIEPTSTWETGKKDEFTDMVTLELLDLSGNSTIQVLPSLSSATGLKTLVLDGCVGLEQVGPEGLPPSLETFKLDAKSNKLSKISLAGCVHLRSFLLGGELPGLEELNLSGTSVKRVDLSDKVVQVQGLKKLFLIGCKQLRAILWWEETRKLEVLRIDTTLEAEDTRPHYYSDSSPVQHRNYVVAGDARIIQSLLNKEYATIIMNSLYLDLHVPVPPTTSSGKSKGPSRDKDTHEPCCYSDVLLDGVFGYYDTEMRWPPPLDRHMEVGEGVSLTDVESDKGIKAIHYVMLQCINSLHVHDNSCILDVTPKRPRDEIWWYEALEWCRVESCPKIEALFGSFQSTSSYRFLKTIWASDLPAAACIWRKRSIYDDSDSFHALQSIHLHKCPRLKFVLPLSHSTYLPSLETLDITQCGELRQVFPWGDVNVPQQYREADPVKEFPKLKHILLHDLYNLQEICEAKMSAPKLESVRIRSCWGLRRLPAVGHGDSSHRPVVHCEKDWWANLKWDGLHAGHHTSLYEPRYSSAYYKKRFLRATVLQ